MDWQYWHDFFGDQYNEFFNDYPYVSEVLCVSEQFMDYGDAFAALEESHGKEIDKAIRSFAKTGRWPKVSKIAGALLKERFSAASQLCSDMKYVAQALKMGPPTRKMTQAQTIRWFLIEIWYEFVCESLINDMSIPPFPHSKAAKRNLISACFGTN